MRFARPRQRESKRTRRRGGCGRNTRGATAIPGLAARGPPVFIAGPLALFLSLIHAPSEITKLPRPVQFEADHGPISASRSVGKKRRVWTERYALLPGTGATRELPLLSRSSSSSPLILRGASLFPLGGGSGANPGKCRPVRQFSSFFPPRRAPVWRIISP